MSNNRLMVNPKLLTWARERAGLEIPKLAQRFPRLVEWEAGTLQPTLGQLEKFAHSVHVPIGYLFLPEPIEEPIPIPDFRTLANREVVRPSPDLLDTLYLCQQRQDWYREYAQMHGLPRLDFVGSVTVESNPITVATGIGERLGVGLAERQQCGNWTEALR